MMVFKPATAHIPDMMQFTDLETGSTTYGKYAERSKI